MKDTLRRLLNTPITVGTVTGLCNGVAEIATVRGRMDAAVSAGLRVGDAVQIDNGVVFRINRPAVAETYFV